MAATNVARAPNRSATQPLTGTNTASASKYVVSASFSAIGSVARSSAIAGSDVVSTVESRFSMNSPQATIKGSRRDDFMAGLRSGAQPLCRLASTRARRVSRPRSAP